MRPELFPRETFHATTAKGGQVMNEPIGRSRRSVVLVVDDVEGNRELLCRRLEPFGYEMHQADSGEAALEFIRMRRPDLVLLDYMMPNMNGVDVVTVMRQDWQIASIPVIMVTARTESDAVVRALDAGADDYVTKPIDFDVLRARIEAQLAKLRTSDQLKQANAALDERATMRVMAFDELKDELEREIIQRRQAEKALKEAQTEIEQCHSRCLVHDCAERDRGKGDPAVSVVASSGASSPPNVSRALEMVDAMSRAVAAGKPINPAILSALRKLLTEQE